jgi:hypothetical protein
MRTGIEYVGSFVSGLPVPFPQRLDVRFPQVSDKKRGLLPPELPRNKHCNPELVFKVAIESNQVTPPQEEGDAGNRGNAASHAQDSTEWHICTNESNRTIWVSVHRGWPDKAGVLGDRVDAPCLHVPASAECANAQSGNLESCAEKPEQSAQYQSQADPGSNGKEEGPSQQSVSPEFSLRTVRGEAELEQVQFGDSDQSLAAGQYTLVFESDALPPCVVPFLAT